MKKGINTATLEGRQALTNLVNEMLEDVPVVTVAMMLESLYGELNKLVKETVAKEKEEMAKQEEIESQQVEYKPEE